MQGIQFKNIFFLLASVISTKVVETNTSFLEVLDKILQNALFCCNYNMYTFYDHVISYSNNFGSYPPFFSY